MVFSSIQTSDAGNYTVAITNTEGSVTSAVAFVRVLLPPTITAQPTNFPSLSVGASVSNRVVASGTTPLNYQWRRDGTPLATKLNATLVLTNLQLADAGEYTVVVTNVAGSVTSRVARLEIDPTFIKITTGSIVNDGGYGFGCAWGDYNNDGFIDLLVCNFPEDNGSSMIFSIAIAAMAPLSGLRPARW